MRGGFVRLGWAVAFGLLAGAAPPPDAPGRGGLAFQRLVVNTGGERAEACLRFSEDLDPRAEAHYGDYLRVEPAATPALRVDGRNLCLAGLGFGARYAVTLRKGLPAASGARTGADETVTVTLADRPPLVAVSGAGFILPRDTAHGLTIQTVNVGRVRVHVFRMGQALLQRRAGSNEGYPRLDLSLERIDRYALRSLLESSATPVWSGTMDAAPDRNRTVETAFPLAGIVRANAPGAYLVVAENAAAALPESFFSGERGDDADASASLAAHWVVATDIALTTVTGRDGLHVFARSLATAKPMAGVALTLTAAGQDALGRAVTDADGQAAFAPGLLRGKGAAEAATLAAAGPDGDFTLIRLNGPAFDLSDRGVSGQPSPGPVQAFLATERGVYRPGETVNATVLLRDAAGAALDGAPLTLVLRRPDGVEARRYAPPAAAGGGFQQAVPLTATAARGGWTLEARVDPTGPAVGRASFEVQDFVPQQLAVTLRTPQPALVPGGTVEAALQGRFLYGAPAAGLHGEAELRFLRDPAPVPAARSFQFGRADETVGDAVQKLDLPDADASGTARLHATLDPPPAASAPLKAVLRAGLSEPGGRVVSDQVELPVRKEALLIGLRERRGSGGGGVLDEHAAAVEVLAFDGERRPVARPGLRWSVVRERRVYDWLERNGGWTFHYHVVDEPVRNGTVEVVATGAPAVVTASLDWGSYRLIVDDPASGAVSSVRLQVGWAPVSGDADAPDKLEVTADSSVLSPGRTARLHVKGPFAGEAQLVIAGDRVFETRTVHVPAEGADLDVTARAEWGPGAYALVSLFRPLDRPARPHDPVRAVGVAWLGLDPAPHTLAVSLGAPAKALPRGDVVVPVRVAGAAPGQPVTVTLAAVDEGILQLTRFRTPDPAGALFGKRRLGVDVRDSYGHLLDGSAAAGTVREGGDEGVGGAGLPVTSTRIVSLFSGPVTLGADGTGAVTLHVPDFEGELRLMALAWSRDAVGSAEAPLLVRDPVLADVALPRFLAPGDAARVAVSVADTDGPAGSYHVEVSAAGAVRTEGERGADVTLAPGERRALAVGLAGVDAGVGTVGVDLTGPAGYRLHREWQVAVRPPHYPVVLAQTAPQAPGAAFRVDPRQLDPFIPGSVSVTVGYAAVAGLDTAALLRSLYRYPYGCSEQLASSAWPLLYFDDPALLGRVPRDAGVSRRVQGAVDELLDREDAAGRFGLWRVGDGEASPWLGAYVVDFLLHAREAGFAVPEEAMGRALASLAETARSSGDDPDGRYGPTAAESRAYALFVLARAGQGDPGAARRLHDTLSREGTGRNRLAFWGDGTEPTARGYAGALALGQLGAALALAGERDRAHDAFAMALDNLGAPAQDRSAWFLWTYWSTVRDLAGLAALAAEGGEDALAQALLGRLSALKPSAPDLSTQEKAALLAAAHALNRDEPGRELTVNGRETGPLKLPTAFSPDPAAVAAGFTVLNSGTKGLWRTLTVEGAPRDALPALESGYRLTRKYLALDGRPFDPARVRQNDRFLVVLSGAAADNDDHRTVLVDMLPAGVEIEAPVTGETQYPFLGALSRTRVREARDDRFVAAFDLGPNLASGGASDDADDDAPGAGKRLAPGQFRVAYVARVVTPGRFARPEAVVEDMYRPDLKARTEAGETVADPR